MATEVPYGWPDAQDLAGRLANVIRSAVVPEEPGEWGAHYKVWGIPRGGGYVAALLMAEPDFLAVSEPDRATVAVDDIIDTGATARRVHAEHGLTTYSLISKCPGLYSTAARADRADSWVTFPWEYGGLAADREDTVRRMLQQIGEDPTRPGLVDTPARVAASWDELYGGYAIDPAGLLKCFPVEDDPEPATMQAPIIVRDIPFVSTCEHHLLPFSGKVTVAYIADAEVIGLSKIPRVVDALARRLQVQERLTQAIASAVGEASKGAAVRVVSNHTCVAHRGVGMPDVAMDTRAYSGIYAASTDQAQDMRATFVEQTGGMA